MYEAGKAPAQAHKLGPFKSFTRALYYAGRSIRSHGERHPGIGIWDGIVVDEFGRIYYEALNRTWKNMTFRGINIWKNPIDLWVYQELLNDLRPDLIIETGTAVGGSAFYLATLCDVFESGEIVSVDVKSRENLPQHPRITYITGSSVDPVIVEKVGAMAAEAKTVMVILDSDHSRDHVAAELRAYGPMVTLGSLVIVEDTNINGHPVKPRWGPGPFEAARDFLAQTDEFIVDTSCEKFFLTFNPRGYLRRVGSAPLTH